MSSFDIELSGPAATYWLKLWLSTLLKITNFSSNPFNRPRAAAESGKAGHEPTDSPNASAAS